MCITICSTLLINILQDELIDLPLGFRSTQEYSATLGHKVRKCVQHKLSVDKSRSSLKSIIWIVQANHQFGEAVNCVLATAWHPVRGEVGAILATRTLHRGQEVGKLDREKWHVLVCYVIFAS